MPVAGAYLLAVLNGIAAQGHSRTIAVSVVNLVFGQPLLNHLHHFLFREKLVGAAFHVFFGKVLGSLERLVKGQLTLQSVLLLGFPMARWYHLTGKLPGFNLT
jgi:hypothetical protein